jgi:hypothetical protein
MCRICGEFEVMTFAGGTMDCCSAKCADEAHEGILDALSDSRGELTECADEAHEGILDALSDSRGELTDDGEPGGSHDLSDDAEALASAGYGTDEDYGYYGEDSHLDSYYEDRFDIGVE